jgi:hypothetical protein
MMKKRMMMSMLSFGVVGAEEVFAIVVVVVSLTRQPSA